jgi:hypothetical protein
MRDLDNLYARFLTVGFVVLRQAVESQRQDWIDAEIELLHNIPSLIGEDNVERHKYFWCQERPHYIQRISQGPTEAKSRMATYYKPIWEQMEPIMSQFCPK